MQGRGVWGSANYFEWPKVADAVIEAIKLFICHYNLDVHDAA
jgi:hypothetical protein